MLLPGPKYPPIVVVLIPANSMDDVAQIHALHMKLRKMGEELNMFIIAGVGDGAASKLAAQNLMDKEALELEPLCYDYAAYGVHVQAPVFEKTGPFTSNQDPPHGQKTGHNQLQHGTKASSLGNGYLVNRLLVDLYETQMSSLVCNDVINVNKQDDGAAYHASVLKAATTIEDGKQIIVSKFSGIFVYNYILSEHSLAHVKSNVILNVKAQVIFLMHGSIAK